MARYAVPVPLLRRGFTLIELLVLTSILGILVALLSTAGGREVIDGSSF